MKNRVVLAVVLTLTLLFFTSCGASTNSEKSGDKPSSNPTENVDDKKEDGDCSGWSNVSSAVGNSNLNHETSKDESKPADNKAGFTFEGKKIENIKASTDFNQNGLDDYTDFVNGARKDARIHPKYDGKYIGKNNGYPSSSVGVCTDVVWRAFREAGYSVRSMVNADIKKNPKRYPMVKKPSHNIDFRRVKTLRPFWQAYCKSLEIEYKNPSEWQPGDIVIFNPNDYHIGMLSDKRNKLGFPYVFHNQGQFEREEDFLPNITVSGHFRFEADKIPAEVLKAWQNNEAGEGNN